MTFLKSSTVRLGEAKALVEERQIVIPDATGEAIKDWRRVIEYAKRQDAPG
ncbi:hypothetical protein [Streptacidiphilus neutrinimicus]|uniref:hypothetical protein n=1 Tax=Streptacidiphilus neutrinimicus TaxID=105420 RepID=UPI0013768800|nr:hypothetical protein [Streptacidiphilus neutrinimicus]